MRSWSEFMTDHWEKESPVVRNAIKKQGEEENALLKEWN
jgi:hypothetical protein